MSVSTPGRPVIDALERARLLDVPAQALAKKVRKVLAPDKLKAAGSVIRYIRRRPTL